MLIWIRMCRCPLTYRQLKSSSPPISISLNPSSAASFHWSFGWPLWLAFSDHQTSGQRLAFWCQNYCIIQGESKLPAHCLNGCIFTCVHLIFMRFIAFDRCRRKLDFSFWVENCWELLIYGCWNANARFAFLSKSALLLCRLVPPVGMRIFVPTVILYVIFDDFQQMKNENLSFDEIYRLQ